MGDPGVDQATLAFRRVLADASAGEQARVDALVLLAQRMVYVATWPGPNHAARTLTNSHGESALPLFTGSDALEATATRFGWRNADGSLQSTELTAHEALRHAIARNVQFVVIDIGCDHSVEFAREEIEPLLQQATQSGTGPHTGASERQAAILEAVRRNSNRPPRPGTALPIQAQLVPDAAKPLPRELTLSSPPMAARPRSPLTPPRPIAPAAGSINKVPAQLPTQPRTRPASTEHTPTKRDSQLDLPYEAPKTRDDEPTVTERGMTHAGTGDPRTVLPDATLQALCAGLRAFPEVEWACVLSDGSEIPLIALRIDPSFLNRVTDITDVIMDVAEEQALGLQVLLLNNQELVKRARKHGHAFYPWRR
jgi:hypothetical protein